MRRIFGRPCRSRRPWTETGPIERFAQRLIAPAFIRDSSQSRTALAFAASICFLPAWLATAPTLPRGMKSLQAFPPPRAALRLSGMDLFSREYILSPEFVSEWRNCEEDNFNGGNTCRVSGFAQSHPIRVTIIVGQHLRRPSQTIADKLTGVNRAFVCTCCERNTVSDILLSVDCIFRMSLANESNRYYLPPDSDLLLARGRHIPALLRPGGRYGGGVGIWKWRRRIDFVGKTLR